MILECQWQKASHLKTASFFFYEWCNWCQGLFFEMFFNGLIWFRGRELHFVQVRVKASCQTKIPKWRYKWTVDITGIRSVFIRFDSPFVYYFFHPLCFSMSVVALKGQTLPDCSSWLTGWSVIKRARLFPPTATHTLTQVQLSYFPVLTLCHLLHRHLFSFTSPAGSWPEFVLLCLLAK